MPQRPLRLIALAWACLAALGCARTVTIENLEPAPAHEVTQLRRLAVLPFHNDRRNVTTAALEHALTSVLVQGRPYFTIVDYSAKGYFPESQGVELVFNDSALGAYGRKAGADGVLLGTVTRNDLRDVPTEEKRSVCVSWNENGGCSRYATRPVRCLRRTGTFAFIPKVAESRGGKVIYSEEFAETAESRVCRGDGEAPAAGEDLITRARGKAIARFLRQVAPHPVREDVPLLLDDNSGLTSADKKAIDAGADQATSGRMSSACDTWAEVAARNPRSYALPYLLGVCDEHAGRLEQALIRYQEADRHCAKPVEEIDQAQIRVRRALADRERLRQQTR